jgi:mono/diheme cytochrome c family protein
VLKYVLIILAALCILTVAVLGVRGTTSRLPPMMFFKDFEEQPRYANQGASPFFPDGRQMRPIPPGTVAWGRDAGEPDKSLLHDDAVAFAQQRIPVPVTMELLQRGQHLYNIHCVVCHGGFGNGNGVATHYGMAPPANIHGDRIREVSDGYLYQVITEGRGLMGPYGPSIRPMDRWAVVAYTRALQRAGSGRIEDVPMNLRPELLAALPQPQEQPAPAEQPEQPAPAQDQQQQPAQPPTQQVPQQQQQ